MHTPNDWSGDGSSTARQIGHCTGCHTIWRDTFHSSMQCRQKSCPQLPTTGSQSRSQQMLQVKSATVHEGAAELASPRAPVALSAQLGEGDRRATPSASRLSS